MRTTHFRGGVHPPDYKTLSRSVPIEALAAPAKVRVPLAQHLGVPASALVKKGDQVRVGQPIGACVGFVSAAVHAPVAGVVSATPDVNLHTNRVVPGIEIENDGSDALFEGVAPVATLDRAGILKAVQAAGIVGMGGATFPSHVKLQPPPEKKINLLIINAAECEPFLTCDYRLLLEDGERVMRGAALLMTALDVHACIIAIEDNKPDAAAHLRTLLTARTEMRVALLPTHYPQGGEKQLIYALTKREVPSGGLPMDVGCVVHNVGTAAAVADAIERGMPLIERVVTVSGDAVERPGNYRVRIGTPLRAVLEAAGADPARCAKVVVGGPMTGATATDLDAPVIKGTSGVLAFTAAWLHADEPRPCVRCGRCGKACPIGLQPTQLEALATLRDVAALQAQHASDCIECGCCAYICPSRRALVHGIRFGKAQIAALRKAKKT
jgi:electron transport complex protein RnfC